MDFLDKRIEDYSQIFSDREPSLLKEIHDYTLQNVHQPRMLSGHLQGRFLSMISKIKRLNLLKIKNQVRRKKITRLRKK